MLPFEYRMFFTAVFVLHGIWWFGIRTPPTSKPADEPESGTGDLILFETEELELYRGEPGQPGLYLAILGKVYDVQSGQLYYGPGGSYHGFVGYDRSVAFSTGNPEPNDLDNSDEDMTDVLKLKDDDLAGIQRWKTFYDDRYPLVGIVQGRFYGPDGQPTEYMQRVERRIQKLEAEKDKTSGWKKELPPCNVEWKANVGSRVWCTANSGGVDRDWVGVPRRFFEPGQKNWRCACVREVAKYANFLKPYAGCPSDETSCVYGEADL